MQYSATRGRIDAASVPLQCIFREGDCAAQMAGIALLLPDAEQRLEAWCAIGLSRKT